MRHIDAVVSANKLAGGTFFDRRTICYFRNKVLPTMYGGKYFLSYHFVADGGTNGMVKLYTIRKVLDNGLIGVEGTRNGYTSKRLALAAIQELLDGALTA